MDSQEKIEEIRAEIKKLQKEREIAILEKGLSAQFNNDLRENAQYDYWVDQEYYYSFKIQGLLKKIEEIKNKAIKIKKKPKVKNSHKKIEDPSLKIKHKWL